jgi:hypothetical protein
MPRRFGPRRPSGREKSRFNKALQEGWCYWGILISFDQALMCFDSVKTVGKSLSEWPERAWTGASFFRICSRIRTTGWKRQSYAFRRSRSSHGYWWWSVYRAQSLTLTEQEVEFQRGKQEALGVFPSGKACFHKFAFIKQMIKISRSRQCRSRSRIFRPAGKSLALGK